MTNRSIAQFAILLASLFTATACEEGSPWGIGGEGPIFKDGNGDQWCAGVGIGGDGKEVDIIDVIFHECNPLGGYFTCSGADIEYSGSFGGATCQGYIYDNDPEMVSDDTYSLYFAVTVFNQNDVVEATITYETDMMDEPFSEVLWPTIDGSDRLFSLHVLNPGYTNDGNSIEYTLDVRLNGVQIKDPTVWATLNGQTEDVNLDSNSEYDSRW